MQTETTLRKASAEEFRTIFEWMKRQFHGGELKPLAQLERMRADGRYEVYGLWRGTELLAYALLACTADRKLWMLDYYAVLPEHQDAGWGGRFLSQLRRVVPGDAILLEVEDPDLVEDASEKARCQRRMRFYDRSQCLHTDVCLNLFGFNYVILALPIASAPENGEIHAALEEIYHMFFPPEDYAENVRFRPDKRHG